ncbi:hypothetical protein E2562_027072 [Oryza meyeriana var. granulata]|uniref:DUF834 domain-containing protein n=1 Tax=Oryza meyeriana var. granulata TaxID=110450 RepID=A0A6G1EZE5_9ORYZ|nr:hypothetical protein E2562_027072 [Oryza meyeriana var. granulata]
MTATDAGKRQRRVAEDNDARQMECGGDGEADGAPAWQTSDDRAHRGDSNGTADDWGGEGGREEEGWWLRGTSRPCKATTGRRRCYGSSRGSRGAGYARH